MELVFNFLFLLIAHSMCLQKHEIMTPLYTRNVRNLFVSQCWKWWFLSPSTMEGKMKEMFKGENIKTWLLFCFPGALFCAVILTFSSNEKISNDRWEMSSTKTGILLLCLFLPSLLFHLHSFLFLTVFLFFPRWCWRINT